MVAQSQDGFEPNALFVKVKDPIAVDLTFSNGAFQSDQGKKYSPLAHSLGVTQIQRPFRIPNPRLQKIYKISLDGTTSIEEVATTLSQTQLIDFVERVPEYQTFFTPDDLHPDQWYIPKVQGELAWDLSQGSADITIAVVDDAILITHEDLLPNLWTNPGEIDGNGIDDDLNGYVDDIHGYDVADGDNNPNPPQTATNDDFTHGTHCAGIAAAATNNGIGMAGLGFSTQFIAIKTKDSTTTGGSLQVPYLGVEYAIAAGADIISMSWGGPNYSQVYEALFQTARDSGIVLIAAAGNSNTSAPMYPASYPNVISVGATGPDDSKTSFSNYGTTIDVMAPGLDIWSTLAGSNTAYGNMSGTSMACPLVSGLAGLMLGRNPAITPAELEACLKSSCDNIDIENPSYIGMIGAGRVNAFEALKCMKPINADFISSPLVGCPGDPINFTDLTNNNPFSWEWSFPGGSPASSTAQHPAVSYAAPGDYDVTLIATNPDGSDTITKYNFIHIEIPTATISGNSTVFLGSTAYLRLDLTGTPPWDVVYFDGAMNSNVNNIPSTPWYVPVTPADTTTYSLVSVADNNCSGTYSGTATVNIDFSPVPCYQAIGEQKISDLSGNFMGTLSNDDFFGRDVTAIGDLDGDEIIDLAVGEPNDMDGGLRRGAVWVLFMNADGTVRTEQKISSTQGGLVGPLNNQDNFGFAVTGIGDMDGDLLPDLAVGAFQDNGGGFGRGAVWILFLNADGTVKAEQKINDITGGFTGTLEDIDWFGCDVDTIGDLDGDNTLDLVVGAYGDDDGGTLTGAVWILFMNPDGTVRDQQKISDTQGGFTGTIDNQDFFGYSVSGPGDVNGDGIEDIVVGAHGDGDGGFGTGAVWVLFLNTDGTVNGFQKISATQGGMVSGPQSGSQFGVSNAVIGDLDGNCVQDIGVGAYWDDDGGTDQGAAWILLLNPDGTVKAEQKLSELAGNFSGMLANDDFWGVSIAGIGDLDGDGGLDLAIGAHGDEDGGQNHGAVWIVNLQNCPRPSCQLAVDFEYQPACAGAPTMFTSIALDTLLPVDYWEWHFGDGDSITGTASPAHVYATSGNFQVTLITSTNNQPPRFDTLTQTIVVPGSFSVSGASPDSLCRGDSVQLSLSTILCGTPPLTYSWAPAPAFTNPSNANPKVALPASDWVWVTVTDDLGNQAIDSIWVPVDTTCCKSYANISLPQTTYCEGDSVFATNASASTAPGIFEWSFASGVPTSFTGDNPPGVWFSSPGQYSIQLRSVDACGADSTTQDLWVIPAPDAEAGADTAVCMMDSIVIGSAMISGYDYNWSPSGGLSNASIAQPGLIASTNVTYTVTITDQVTGCSGIDSINIQTMLPTVPALGPDTSICEGDSLLLDAGDAFSNYIWQDSSALSQFTASTPGTFWVSTIDSNGCEGADSVLISTPTALTPDLGNDTTVCEGDSLLLDAQVSGQSYEWHSGETTQSVFVYDPGIFWVAVTDSSSCTVRDSIEVFFVPLPLVDLGPDTITCSADPITLATGFGAGIDHLWNDNSTANTLSVNSSGKYSVTVTDGNGCQGSDEIDVVYASPPTVFLGNDTGILVGTTLILDAGNPGSTYEWSTGESTQQITAGPGTYSVTVTDVNGCTATDEIEITGMSSLDQGTDIGIVEVFPNPVTELATIAFSGTHNREYALAIVSVEGKVLWSESITPAGSTHQMRVDLSAWADGVYFLTIKSELGISARKLTKM